MPSGDDDDFYEEKEQDDESDVGGDGDDDAVSLGTKHHGSQKDMSYSQMLGEGEYGLPAKI